MWKNFYNLFCFILVFFKCKMYCRINDGSFLSWSIILIILQNKFILNLFTFCKLSYFWTGCCNYFELNSLNHFKELGLWKFMQDCSLMVLILCHFTACLAGTYGLLCKQNCSCLNGGSCRKSDGVCRCAPGYMGTRCSEGIYVTI